MKFYLIIKNEMSFRSEVSHFVIMCYSTLNQRTILRGLERYTLHRYIQIIGTDIGITIKLTYMYTCQILKDNIHIKHREIRYNGAPPPPQSPQSQFEIIFITLPVIELATNRLSLMSTHKPRGRRSSLSIIKRSNFPSWPSR